MRHPTTPSLNGRAFTLVELMLALTIVILLMLGVNTVFRTTVDAVGAGQRLSESTRSQQAAQAVMRSDFDGALADPPFFIIANDQTFMYQNWDDFRSNGQGGDPENVDLNANGVRGEATVPGERVPNYVLNNRSHRIDSVMFFSRGHFRRNTGSPNSAVSDTTAADAFVWYGHALMPNKSGTTYWGPNDPVTGYDKLGGPASWYGVFAADWVVSRQAILLRDPATLNEPHYRRLTNTPMPYMVNLSPLQFNTTASDGSTFQSARYDIAGATLEDIRSIVANAPAEEARLQQTAINNGVPQIRVSWWRSLTHRVPTYTGSLPNNSSYAGYQKNEMDNPPQARFQTDAILTQPLSADNAARLANQFISGCSQFVVEYAGDYLTQDANGIPTAAVPDGVIDFIGIDNDNNGSIDERRIRWYGLPRDVDGDGFIGGWYQNFPRTVAAMNTLRDVIPLRDLICIANNAGYQGQNSLSNRAQHEVEIRVNPVANYGTVTSSNINARPPRYVCVWTNDTPAMIRIVTKVDDPNNKLRDGPWQEQVFVLKK